MSSQLHLAILSLKRSPHTIKQIDQILTQTITTGLLHTTPTLNSILTVYSKSPAPTKAILTYNLSIKNSIPLDNYTYPVLLKACTRLKSLPKGKEVHAHVTKVGLGSDVYVQNALVHFYGSTGLIGDARYVFDKMPHRDLASWNSLLAAYNSRSGDGTEALVLFKEMMCEGIGADSITFVIIISALAAVTKVEYGSSIHGSVIKNGFDCYVHLENAMLGMYVNYGDVNAALTLFTEMGGRRDVVSHTIMINGCIETGFIELARDIFDRRFDKDLVLWNSMISGYVESNLPNEALVLFEKMENEEVEPDQYTVVSILSACACLSDLQYGRHVHRLILTKNMLHDVFVGTALIDMYSKCGSISDAMATFYKMEDKDVFTWTTAIGGLANFGYVKASLELFYQMENEGVNPNEATFVSVLAACRQAGLVEEGCFLFSTLLRNYKIQPKVEHFGCLIDLLSRAGLVHQADEFVKAIDPGERLVAYKTLLSACMNHSKIDLGLKVADELERLGSEDHAVCVLLSNFYALAGEWSKVEEMRRNMKIFGMLKEPGISCVEVTT
ncbi:pentatricopeptide repeat-containing protein At1g31430-like [Rhododendron vialii]|uniref:pentatricopeptide repeat-containing protein At1g31430-like n=1 Tax=Rhododendron vialii TaxID=182163 RepID=UPI00265F8E07|nr:pentatricopeptide repeat-containing protein At1g31430-like [Rhododendron vialii]